MTHEDLQTVRAAFPANFRWGAATSSYQIEGATKADGRGTSIWDTFTATPGKVIDGSDGANAIRSYENPEADVALCKKLGLSAYRFSLSWPRICPDGTTQINQAGLDYYSRLLDLLGEADIEPWVTLYHWDLPQSLEDAGGWPARDTAYRFGDFAAIAAEHFSDRVKNWVTVNEPWCAAFLGYASGEHAPGRREGPASLAAAHHLMLGHGMATKVLREANPEAYLSVGLNFYPVHAATDSVEDIDAARRIDGVQNRFFADAAVYGKYPADVVEDLSAITDFGFVQDGDMDIISTDIDGIGVNYYSRFTVSADNSQGAASASAAPTDTGSAWPGNEHIGFVGSDLPLTDMGWEIDPSGLTTVLRTLHERYPSLTFVVTENGAAFKDEVEQDKVEQDEVEQDEAEEISAGIGSVEYYVDDPARTSYFHTHLHSCAVAIGEGIPLQGYFAWSLADNFEWAWGYSKRFGLAYVDFPTSKRTLKSSGRWYADFIRGV